MSEQPVLKRVKIKATHEGWFSFCPVWYSEDREWLNMFGTHEHFSAVPIAKYHLDFLLTAAVYWQMFCQAVYVAITNLSIILGTTDPMEVDYRDTGFVMATSKLKEPITIYREIEDDGGFYGEEEN
jgi:hypothetical protein